MRTFNMLLIGAALVLAGGVQANAQVTNEKLIQRGFNPQPDPPKVKAATKKVNPAAKSKIKGAGGEKGIVIVGGKPGSKGAAKMGVSPEPFKPGSSAAAKGLLPAVQPRGKR